MTTPASPSKRLSVSDHADVLACHICLEVYDERGHEAKFLSCHHSFCSACLAHLAAKTHDYIECPSCRAHTSLTEAGISGNDDLPNVSGNGNSSFTPLERKAQ